MTNRKKLKILSVVLPLGIVLLALLALTVWIGRELWQQHLDHALIAAIKNDDTSAAIALINQGASANAVDSPDHSVNFHTILTDFWRRLRHKKIHADDAQYDPALAVLLHSIKNVEGEDERPEKEENLTLVRALLAHGADVNAIDTDGAALLELAAEANAPETVVLLVEKGANPNSTDSEEPAPLMWMIVNDHPRAVKLLLEKGADPNQEYQGEYTPLYNAIHANNASMVRWLLAKGADPNGQCPDKRTPLYEAHKVHNKVHNMEIVRALIKAGAHQ